MSLLCLILYIELSAFLLQLTLDLVFDFLINTNCVLKEEEVEAAAELEGSEAAIDATDAQVPTTLADVEDINKEPEAADFEQPPQSPSVQVSDLC